MNHRWSAMNHRFPALSATVELTCTQLHAFTPAIYHAPNVIDEQLCAALFNVSYNTCAERLSTQVSVN